jgi:hypothetical protein
MCVASCRRACKDLAAARACCRCVQCYTEARKTRHTPPYISFPVSRSCDLKCSSRSAAPAVSTRRPSSSLALCPGRKSSSPRRSTLAERAERDASSASTWRDTATPLVSAAEHAAVRAPHQQHAALTCGGMGAMLTCVSSSSTRPPASASAALPAACCSERSSHTSRVASSGDSNARTCSRGLAGSGDKSNASSPCAPADTLRASITYTVGSCNHHSAAASDDAGGVCKAPALKTRVPGIAAVGRRQATPVSLPCASAARFFGACHAPAAASSSVVGAATSASDALLLDTSLPVNEASSASRESTSLADCGDPTRGAAAPATGTGAAGGCAAAPAAAGSGCTPQPGRRCLPRGDCASRTPSAAAPAPRCWRLLAQGSGVHDASAKRRCAGVHATRPQTCRRMTRTVATATVSASQAAAACAATTAALGCATAGGREVAQASTPTTAGARASSVRATTCCGADATRASSAGTAVTPSTERGAAHARPRSRRPVATSACAGQPPLGSAAIAHTLSLAANRHRSATANGSSTRAIA